MRKIYSKKRKKKRILKKPVFHGDLIYNGKRYSVITISSAGRLIGIGAAVIEGTIVAFNLNFYRSVYRLDTQKLVFYKIKLFGRKGLQARRPYSNFEYSIREFDTENSERQT